MVDSKIKDYKPVNGKLRGHFGIKGKDNDKVIDGKKV